jgi:DNA-binding response OmpR family regulator
MDATVRSGVGVNARAAGDAHRIVVIEDEADQRDFVAEVLRAEGFDVYEAADGRDGLALVSRVQPSLILCDVRMPVLGGYDALSEVRRHPSLSRVPFVLLSGNGVSTRDVRNGMNLGADDYLVKPFTADELLETVRARLARHEQLEPPQIPPTLLSLPSDAALPASMLDRRFRLIRSVTAGGMGTIYEATDLTTGQRVAVKIAPGQDEVRNARLEREALALAALDDEHIVSFLQLGHTPGGATYMVIPWIEGHDLQQHLQGGPMPLADVLAVGERVAAALAASHAKGILHRDVKPSNIVLRDGRPERAVLIDFGLATMPELNTLTEAGSVLGTMGFIAPEQVLGYRDIDARIDVFSLGCVLFQCLTGEAPFSMANTLAAIASVLFETPTRLRALRPELPQALDDLLFAMMSRVPSDRPSDGADALAHLRAIPR